MAISNIVLWNEGRYAHVRAVVSEVDMSTIEQTKIIRKFGWELLTYESLWRFADDEVSALLSKLCNLGFISTGCGLTGITNQLKEPLIAGMEAYKQMHKQRSAEECHSSAA